MLSAIGFVLISLKICLQFNPVFNPQNASLLLLLPLAWGSIAGIIPNFQADAAVITPKNFMLFVWFNRLVIIPLEILWVGNSIPVETYLDQPITVEIIITLVSFFAFALGWVLRTPTAVYGIPPLSSLKIWAGLYGLIAIGSILLLYGSIDYYFSKASFTYITLEIAEKNNTVSGFLANVGQRFWPFGVFFAWYQWRKSKARLSWFRHIPWLLLGLAGSLSSNRSNMAYPLLMLMSVMYSNWKTPYKLALTLFLSTLLLLFFFWGYVRVQPFLDIEQVERLFNNYLEQGEYISYAHQLYVGSPYQITPLLSVSPASPTLLASFLDPIPMIGKAFREQSGPYIYNLAYHQSLISQDKVIPVAGELYYNGGYGLVAGGYVFFGVVYRWLDHTFKANVVANPPLAVSFFYLTLLFNATLMLSLSVLTQLIVYNAAPALLIIAANWLSIRKAS